MNTKNSNVVIDIEAKEVETRKTFGELSEYLMSIQDKLARESRQKILMEILENNWSIEEYMIVQVSLERRAQGDDTKYTAEEYAQELIENVDLAEDVVYAEENYRKRLQ